MNAQEYIRSLNFMVNVGTEFDYKKEYEKLSAEDKQTVDVHLSNTTYIPTY